MTNASILTLLCVAILRVGFSLLPNPMIGRWQQEFSDGRRALAVFRADSTLDFFVNWKASGRGRYYVQQDTLGLSYASCNGAYTGTYRLSFFAHDSVQFSVLEDTCRERRLGMDGVTMGRVD
ncbi:hypothetical protein [Spirosoma endophyticum]|uniref:Uncharacterized protein n=1 Tax=Spirosoma endophyticum TaxID=662367 RepID=A0A1I1XHZ3_9BACT|nr:hypothetical protein [Spirosoma endophyticum]SFE06912.1 hypothetical protein SAMN05216167_1107 [Spirosoma endophyticum]